MTQSLRKSLAESHVAAIAIAILMFWASGGLVSIVGPLFEAVVRFLFFAVGAVDLSFGLTAFRDLRNEYQVLGLGIAFSLLEFVGAFLVAKFVYGAGPIAVLVKYGAHLGRNNHV
jgi:hypothetical protein